MKIALICGHFINGMNYVEEIVADDLCQLGHELRVFTSSIVPKKLHSNPSETKNYEITRLPVFFSIGNMVIPKNLKREINNYAPDLIIMIGVGKLFPMPLLISRKKHCPWISYFGDNEDYIKWGGFRNSLNSLKNLAIRNTVKRVLYNLAFKKCDLIVGYTGKTLKILQSFTFTQKNIIRVKYFGITLGYNEDMFFYDFASRETIRNKLNLRQDEVLFITATRLVPEKRIERQIDFFKALYQEGLKFKVVFIGGLEDAYYDKLMKFVPGGDYIQILPLMTSSELRTYYSAADYGFWFWASISILQAMGTGLPIILPDRASVNHLIKVGVNGILFKEDYFNSAIKELLSAGIAFDRENVTRYNTCFSSRKITESVINQFVYRSVEVNAE